MLLLLHFILLVFIDFYSGTCVLSSGKTHIPPINVHVLVVKKRESSRKLNVHVHVHAIAQSSKK